MRTCLQYLIEIVGFIKCEPFSRVAYGFVSGQLNSNLDGYLEQNLVKGVQMVMRNSEEDISKEDYSEDDFNPNFELQSPSPLPKPTGALPITRFSIHNPLARFSINPSQIRQTINQYKEEGKPQVETYEDEFDQDPRVTELNRMLINRINLVQSPI